jgi:peptide/nickel transport system permease protein
MVVARFFRSSPLGGVCALLLLFLVSVAVMADRLAPHNPLTANYALTRDPPLGRHVLGTDHLGRDVLSRIIFGARVTLLVAISSVLLGDTIGFVWGVASGYLGGRVDLLSQRLLDVLMSLPALILALLLMAALGPGCPRSSSPSRSPGCH